ncbi:hypothetical protein [Nitratifractor sp.]
MRDLSITINGVRLTAKRLDDDFAAFVEEHLEAAGVGTNRDNSADRLFAAYLKLASESYNYEKEIEEIINDR